jgi:hypothetical protein
MTHNSGLLGVAIAILNTLIIQIAHADGNSIEQRKILPYLEAEGETTTVIYKPNIAWISPEKVMFGSDVKSSDNSIENLEDTSINFLNKTRQVKLFDIAAIKSEIYKNGQFLSYEDGVVTIALKKVISKNSSAESYDELLKGPLSEDVPITLYHSKTVKLQKQCPMDNDISALVRTSIRLLRNEHGCIRVPYPFNNNSDPHTYFLADGRKMNLPIPAGDQIGLAIWIDWIKAYVLGDNVTVNIGRTAGVPKNTPTIKLFFPSGELKLIEMGGYGFTHARPTRAGMIAAKNRSDSGSFATKVNGLFLWRDGRQYQITEGNVAQAEVSPNGCKVAFYAEHKNILSRGSIASLRVIDVCEGFGVNSDENPFK